MILCAYELGPEGFWKIKIWNLRKAQNQTVFSTCVIHKHRKMMSVFLWLIPCLQRKMRCRKGGGRCSFSSRRHHLSDVVLVRSTFSEQPAAWTLINWSRCCLFCAPTANSISGTWNDQDIQVKQKHTVWACPFIVPISNIHSAPLHLIPAIDGPFEPVMVNCVNLLPCTKNGNEPLSGQLISRSDSTAQNHHPPLSERRFPVQSLQTDPQDIRC